MIYLATDHRGFELKEKIKIWLKDWGYEFEDCGASEYNPQDDYPDFVVKVASAVSRNPGDSRGIVLGMTGQGEAIAANRFKNVRATVFYGPSFDNVFSGHFIYSWFRFTRIFLDRWWITAALNKTSSEIIRLSREHNDANVLSLGTIFLDENVAKVAIKLWLETKFSNEPRHARRIQKIDTKSA